MQTVIYRVYNVAIINVQMTIIKRDLNERKIDGCSLKVFKVTFPILIKCTFLRDLIAVSTRLIKVKDFNLSYSVFTSAPSSP